MNGAMVLAEHAPGEPHLFGWNLGFAIAIVVITVVVALVAPILVIAGRIGRQAQMINEALQQAYRNTLPELRETIGHAQAIIAGLERGRARLGG
jgi:predicted PurR-regulated permease PerM